MKKKRISKFSKIIGFMIEIKYIHIIIPILISVYNDIKLSYCENGFQIYADVCKMPSIKYGMNIVKI